MENEKIIKIYFEGIDDFNRPVFRDENNNRYGSTRMLFHINASEFEVLNVINEKTLIYFGKKFNCEPDGGDPGGVLKVIKKGI
jgi:hypothetical protein